ncbi:AAEL017465-PA [Aedes aegypti]|uniref:AAEL017465-PA n=1 Tax=Aedes aegypti TaxID=7159 RepID=J9HZK2_AEDAE|nr:AAEL017465-PA [Aedes aegypti]
MSKLSLAFALILCTIVAFGEGAVVIRRPSNSNESPAQGTRIISVLPSDDKYPRKRDSPAIMKEVPTLPEGSRDRSTFSVNKRRPCTFCKFFTTVTPSPKPKMYFKFVQP